MSGGESQRIRLASQIGSGLTGVLYVLDEPSIGLHQRDNSKLLESLKGLRDMGNTVLVVEHDEDAIRHADHVIDMGPGAGVHGGHIIAEGTPADIMANKKSLTGTYLNGTEVRSTRNQIDDLLGEIRARAGAGERVLVTTLTKRMAEDLTEYYTEVGVRCRYLHSEIETLERVKILRDLRKGEFDVLIGINLLREGLDLPEVSLVAILDADKEGFLRSAGSLIQTIGRAARNINGKAILYADVMTDSIRHALAETTRRREKQTRFNEENGITPQSIVKPVHMTLAAIVEADYVPLPDIGDDELASPDQLEQLISGLEKQMREAAKQFEFEKAAQLRDRIKALKEKEGSVRGTETAIS